MAVNESWRLEVLTALDRFQARLKAMMAEIDEKINKQKLKQMDNGDNETHDSYPDMDEVEIEEEVEAEYEKEAKVEAEIEVIAQASMDTETKVVVMKDPFQLKKPTKFEEDERLLAQLDDVNSDKVEQLVAAQNHKHEVISKTLHVFDTCERFDGVYSMVFGNKFVAVKDPYGFRLLVMGREIDLALKINARNYGFILNISTNCFAKRLKNVTCLQSLQQPSCVWDAKLAGHQDIVTASSNGDIRIWSVDQGNVADPSKFETYASEFFQYKVSRKSIDGLKLKNLLGLGTLQISESTGGWTDMVREWDNGAYRENLILICIMGSSKLQIVKAWEIFVEFVDPNGYAMESSKQLADGLINLDDMGYKTLLKYYQDLVHDGFGPSVSSNSGWKIGEEVSHFVGTDIAGTVIVKEFVSRAAISQFRTHTSPISAICFDPSGTFLVTISIHRNNRINFRIMPSSTKNGSDTQNYDWSYCLGTLLYASKVLDKVPTAKFDQKFGHICAFAHIGAERRFEYKENFLQLVKVKYHRIEGLMQVAGSMEEDFNSSLNSFPSKIVEKETQIKLVNEAWEKIVRAEILAKLEIEEKKLIIVEFKDELEEKFGGGTQSREIGNDIEEIGRHLFQTSHLFHQCSSHQLKSAFSRSSEDGVTLELDLVGASSPTLPLSVSRSGKDYRSKKWKGNCHDISLNKIQPMKVLNGKPSLAYATLCKDDLRKELKMDPDLPTVLCCCWGSGILFGATHGVSIIGGKSSTIAWFITKVELLFPSLRTRMC